MKSAKEEQWQTLENLWRRQPAEAPIPDEMRRRVRRQERRMRIGAVLEWLVAIALCTYAIWFAVENRNTNGVLWLLVVFALVAWAVGFSTANRRGLWCPPEESAQAYIELALLRIERHRQAIRFAWLLYAVELAIFAGWELLARFDVIEASFSFVSVRALATILGVTAVLGGWSLFVWLRCKRERRVFSELQQNSENFL
ncbi:hypothetical protein SAMN04487965_1636 [Microbulbifer donghaiensis]|uniref:Uncharacterized protein n=1 Tax=Microbulbifer donghaiensis TaxID=494016 RepID=A0A1M4ZST4_9GAMM|nr:hypothetical protein [Microbulbifer donghaiensis]SHF20995.1 hypothetical protein SAMN04487965_1636 [Microbulbifer donghaiensis]